MSNEKDMHKAGWANIELPPHLKKAREEQEQLNQEKKDTCTHLCVARRRRDCVSTIGV
mgnify:CR=1 FL=1